MHYLWSIDIFAPAPACLRRLWVCYQTSPSELASPLLPFLWYTTCRWWRPKPELAHLMASEADMYLSLTNGCRILTRSFFSLFLLGASDGMPPMKLWNCAFVAVWHLETCSPAGRVFTHLQEHCELHRIYREDLVQGFPGYGISFLEAIPWMLEESL